jgi:MFS family permease
MPTFGIPLRLPARTSFWVTVAAYLGLMIAAAAPSPLYVVYQQRWHFTAATLTTIFGVYVLALLLSLLTVGGLSDFIGRKPLLIGGFGLLTVSMLVFAHADSVGWLYVARVLQGLAAGTSIGALSAALIDFAGPRRAQLASLANGVVPSLGLALGALAAGALVRFAPAPTVFVYLLLAGLFVLVIAAVAAGPEIEQRHPGALRSLTPRMRVPARAVPQFIRILPALFATWAQLGFVLSLTTTLAAVEFGVHDRFLDALVVAMSCFAAFLASVVTRKTPARTATLLGSAALVGGSALAIVSLAGPWASVFYVGSALGGFGVGAMMGAAIRALSVLPAPAERGEFFAGVYVVGYLAFSIPAIAAGLTVVHVGLVETTVGYGIVISLLAVVAALNALRGQVRPLPPLVVPAATAGQLDPVR